MLAPATPRDGAGTTGTTTEGGDVRRAVQFAASPPGGQADFNHSQLAKNGADCFGP